MKRRNFLCTALSLAVSSTCLAKSKQRTTVVGFGKSLSEAMNDCYRNARLISVSYQTITRSSSGSGTSWTYTMVIEYES